MHKIRCVRSFLCRHMEEAIFALSLSLSLSPCKREPLHSPKISPEGAKRKGGGGGKEKQGKKSLPGDKRRGKVESGRWRRRAERRRRSPHGGERERGGNVEFGISLSLFLSITTIVARP